MGYYFHHKRAPIKEIFRLFLKSSLQFQAFKNSYPTKKRKNMTKFEKFGKKKFWFRKKKVSAPIPIPKLDLGFGPHYGLYSCLLLKIIDLFPHERMLSPPISLSSIQLAIIDSFFFFQDKKNQSDDN